MTWVITYPPSESHPPTYTPSVSHARLLIVFQTCHALAHFVALSIIFPLPEMPLLFFLAPFYPSLFSTDIPSTRQPLQAFAPSWTSPVGEVPWQLVSLPSFFPSHLSATLLQSIFLKCKSNHISFLLKTLSSVASILHKVQTQHSAQVSLLALFQVPTPLFTLCSLHKLHFLPYSFIFQVKSWESLPLWSLSYNHPLTLYF